MILITVFGNSMSRCKHLSRWHILLPADIILKNTSQDVVAADLYSAADDSSNCLVIIIHFIKIKINLYDHFFSEFQFILHIFLLLIFYKIFYKIITR